MKVIIFKDQTHKFIHEQDEQDIYRFSGEGKNGMKLGKDNTPIEFNNIERIEDEKEFYGRNPNLHPSRQVTYSEKKHRGRLEKMRDGFLRGVGKVRNTNNMTYINLYEHQKEMYNQMEKALKDLEAKGTPDFVMGRDNN